MGAAIICQKIRKSYQITVAYCSFIFVQRKRPTQFPLEIVILQ